MKTVKLGPSGPEISQFGLGAMSFAGIYGNASEDESFAVMNAVRAAGVTHIDTSNVYGAGRSEEILGAWFAANPGAREETTIATKAGITGSPEKRFNNAPDYLEAELDGSLKRLGIDCVDLFYIHRLEAERPIEEVAGTLAGLIAKGKAKAVGFSEIAPTSLRRAATEVDVAAVQSEYSLSTRLPELGLSQACASLGTSLVAFCPVGRAFLTDQPFSYERAQSMAFTKGNPRFMEPNYAANIKATDGFRILAKDMGEPAAGVAIAWLMAQGDHVIPIPGTKSVDHFKELLRGTEILLSPSDMAAIEAVLPIGWAHGDRYSAAQWVGPEMYC
ncbi:MAG: aldo/keto reductase [Paracoccaceae bacterium]